MPQLHVELLDQADYLARREPRRPREASLRRSVSAAYYSVFHMLSAEFSSYWPVAARSSISRILDHSIAVKKAAEIKKAGGVHGCQLPAAALQFCEDFIRLQNARHDADYDLNARFTRRLALEHCERARRCVEQFSLLRKSDPACVRALVLTLTLEVKPRVR